MGTLRSHLRYAAKQVRFASALAVASALADPGVALAEHVLEVPESCGTLAELQRELDSLRGVDGGGSLSASVRLTPDGDAFQLEVARPTGARSLRDGDCRSLFRAAIVIAALDGELRVDVEPAPQSPAATSQAFPVPTSAMLSSPKAAPDAGALELDLPLAVPTQRTGLPATPAHSGPKQPPRVAVRTFMAADFVYGMVPHIAVAVGAGLSLTRGPWGSTLALAYIPPRSHYRAEQGVEVEAFAGGITVELVPLSGLRVGLGGGALLLHGRGLSAPTRHKGWAAEPLVSLSVTARVYRRGRWSVDWTARAHWAPRPAGLVVRGFGSVYRSESFAFQTGPAIAFTIR